MLGVGNLASRSSSPSSAPQATHSARVLPQVDRAQRIATMLDRWDREELVDESDRDVADVDG